MWRCPGLIKQHQVIEDSFVDYEKNGKLLLVDRNDQISGLLTLVIHTDENEKENSFNIYRLHIFTIHVKMRRSTRDRYIYIYI